jgi:SAM-dependent methyltransferase/ribosomal protein S27E
VGFSASTEVRGSQIFDLQIRDWILKVKQRAHEFAQEPQALVNVSCPNCEHDNAKYFVNNDALNYVRCQNCTLVYMNPRPAPIDVNEGFKGQDALLMEYFEIIIHNYDATKIKTIQDPADDLLLSEIYRFKKSGRLLDVGCSVGKFLQKAKKIYAVEGVEINPMTRKVAEVDFRVHADFLDKLNLPQVYDIVTLNQILYGVPSPVNLLKDIANVLKPKGILYINTPNSDSYAVELFKGKANHFYGYTSLNIYNPRALEALAFKTGFRVLSCRTEWLDIYTPDLILFLDEPENFIHKKNFQIPNYNETLLAEDLVRKTTLLDLGMRGNYVSCVMEKI